MNPELLELDELDYELVIRKIVNVSTRRLKTSALSKILAEELKGNVAAPTVLPPHMDIEEEFTICQVRTAAIKEDLKRADFQVSVTVVALP